MSASPPSDRAPQERTDRRKAPPYGDFRVALALSGGNALGAYQAGAYQALHDRGIEPDWIAGASAGAINGAIICGNPTERRLESLGSLWAPAGAKYPPQFEGAPEEARRTAAATMTLTAGRPGLFVPRHLFGPWWNPFGNQEPSSLYDSTPMRGTLGRLVDFGLLNRGTPRFSATAVDVETGEDVVFDTSRDFVEVDHLRASSALLPAFSPVEIGGRLLCDAGISANLPLDGVLSEMHDRPLLCIAIDLVPLRGPRPQTIGEAVIRVQDLLFATQSRRAIAAWQALFDERVKHGAKASVTILHIAYSGLGREVSGKAFDFSPQSSAARWQAGQADLGSALDDFASGRIPLGQPGMSVYALADDRARLDKVHWALAPVPVGADARPASESKRGI